MAEVLPTVKLSCLTSIRGFYLFVYFLLGSLYVSQAGLKLLGSSNPLAQLGDLMVHSYVVHVGLKCFLIKKNY
jgi:hypothetical protein